MGLKHLLKLQHLQLELPLPHLVFSCTNFWRDILLTELHFGAEPITTSDGGGGAHRSATGLPDSKTTKNWCFYNNKKFIALRFSCGGEMESV
jgi:hypothetical protein